MNGTEITPDKLPQQRLRCQSVYFLQLGQVCSPAVSLCQLERDLLSQSPRTILIARQGERTRNHDVVFLLDVDTDPFTK